MVGHILCAESSYEQVELLETRKDGNKVSEYRTELPPKADLGQKLQVALHEARERLGEVWMICDDHKAS